jgi:hypothetical protein
MLVRHTPPMPEMAAYLVDLGAVFLADTEVDFDVAAMDTRFPGPSLFRLRKVSDRIAGAGEILAAGRDCQRGR